jgi:hypothetical protein
MQSYLNAKSRMSEVQVLQHTSVIQVVGDSLELFDSLQII